MKWIKLKSAFTVGTTVHAPESVIELDDAVADTLVAVKSAEPAAAPAQAVNKATEIAGSLKSFIESEIKGLRDEQNTTIEAALKSVVAELVRELKPAAGIKGKSLLNSVIRTHDNELDDPKLGFKSLGEQAMAVKNYAVRGIVDERLTKGEAAIKQKAPTNFASEGIGADGGFAVAPDYLPQLLSYAYADDSLLTRCRPLTTAGNTLTVPKDETVAWGTDGVQAYWAGEASTMTDSKVKLGEINITLHKLTALVPVTNELIEDNSLSLDAYIARAAPVKIANKINAAIVGGTGVGQPFGFKNSGAVITKARAGANHVAIADIANLYSLVPKFFRQNAVWLHHSTVLQDILAMTIGQQPTFFPPGMIANTPEGSIFGKALVESEQAQALGTKGDLSLVDFSQYLAVTKSSGMRQDMSVHLYFDKDITTFRFVFRIGGQPWMSAPITQANGGGTISPFVQLNT